MIFGQQRSKLRYIQCIEECDPHHQRQQRDDAERDSPKPRREPSAHVNSPMPATKCHTTAVYVQRDTLLTLESISRSLGLLWKEFSNGKQQSDDCDHRKGGVDNAGVRTFRWIEQDGCQCECRSKKPHGKPCPAIPMTDSKVGDDEREQRQTGEAHIQKLLVQHIGRSEER